MDTFKSEKYPSSAPLLSGNDRPTDRELSEQRYRDLVESSHDWIWEIDGNGIYTYSSPQAREIFGYDPEEIIGKTPFDLMPAAEAERVKIIFSEISSRREPFRRLENICLHKNGSKVVVETSGKPFFDTRGNFLGYRGMDQDITSRKRVQEELFKLNQAIEQSPVSIVITDLAGNIEYVNPKFSQLTGYPAAEALGQNPRLLKSGQTPPEIYDRIWKTLKTGGIWQGEFRNRKKNGALYWEAATIAPIFNSEGNITHYIAVKEDITEKKQTTEKLLLDAIRFQNLSELSLMTQEPDQRVFDFTIEAAVQITQSAFGYIYLMNEEENLLTLNSWSKKVMAECAVPVKPTVFALENTGLWGEAVRRRTPVITNNYEEPNPLKKGLPEGHVTIRRHMNIPLIDNGKIVLVAGVANKEDDYNESDVQQLTLLMSAMWRIIRKKHAESLLRESEEQFHQMFAQNDDAIILINMKSLKVIDANPAALTLYCMPHEQLPECRPRSFIGKDDYRKIIDIFRRDPSYEGVVLEKAIGLRTDGSKFPISLKIKILNINNEQIVLCSIRDITQKIHLEEEIKVSQAKLIQANKMTSLGMLVSGVGHEINNPNNCISINTSVLTNIWEDAARIIQKSAGETGTASIGGLPFDEAQVFVPQLFSGIAESSKRISAIVANMRDFVKNNQGVRRVSFDINKTVMASTTILWHNIQKYTDNFTHTLAENLPLAYGNAQQVEQVIINLIMNALQALPDKSHAVTVTTASDDAAGKIVITIRDNGKGMDKKTLQRLAEPFFTTREAEGGTGLGLYISTTIIKDYNGSLDFDSETGKGTIATIRLPIA